jgi:hypothetical protein
MSLSTATALPLFALLLALLAAVLFGLWTWRLVDARRAARTWRALRRDADQAEGAFSPDMVADLPAPARRYFLFTIAPGTPLARIAEIRMHGQIGLGDRERPNYLPMRAHQVIAVPHGLVWRLRAGRGLMRIGGSDGIGAGRSWTRFWLLGTLPVVRAGGDGDHLRSAYGRVVAEAVFFTPAALLPGPGVHWQAVDDRVARVNVVHAGLEQSVDISVADDGRPTRVVLARWSNANADKVYRRQPFGGELSDFAWFGGFRLPTRIEGGNFIGTGDYFPFYRAVVDQVTFIHRD